MEMMDLLRALDFMAVVMLPLDTFTITIGGSVRLRH
jgi:hypothetical protein